MVPKFHSSLVGVSHVLVGVYHGAYWSDALGSSPGSENVKILSEFFQAWNHIGMVLQCWKRGFCIKSIEIMILKTFTRLKSVQRRE